jgi:hypothetical protein
MAAKIASRRATASAIGTMAATSRERRIQGLLIDSIVQLTI